MAQAGKENLPAALPLQQTTAELTQKESTSLGVSALSSSRIPVLSRSRVPAELKQSQQHSQLQQACPSSTKSKVTKTSTMSPEVSTLGAAILEPVAGLLPKSLSREPLGQVQLNTLGQRNDGKASTGKEVSTVEFVPDVAALASILSNTGLTKQLVSATQKPSLARRVPLRGRRDCSASTGTARSTVCTGVPTANLARASHISGSSLKDTGHPPSYSLTLNTQELKALSATFKNFDSRVEETKPNRSTEKQEVDKCQDSGAKPSTEHPRSNVAEKKPAAGSSWVEEEFVPDPAAKASIISNVGLSRFALGADGKLSLAQRVPVKEVQKHRLASGGAKGEQDFARGPCARVSSIDTFGRVSCRSTQGLKGLASSGTQLTNTPGNRCSALDYSPYGLARRVPIAGPQSSRRTPWTFHQVPTSSLRTLRSRATQPPTEQVTSNASITPHITPGSKEDGTPSSWEQIAVRLFDENTEASARRETAVPVITPDMGKLQRIEHLAQLLQQELKSSVVPEVAPSLEELHKLLSTRCSPALEAPQPGLPCAPLQDPSPDVCKLAPGSAVTASCEPDATLSTSSQHPVHPSPSVHLVCPHPTSTSSSDLAKRRLSEVLHAPRPIQEAFLNEECAFYASRVAPAPQPSMQRCTEPVAKMLAAIDTVHFVPISAHQSPFTEGERSLSS